jgi:hypothetical protein
VVNLFCRDQQRAAKLRAEKQIKIYAKEMIHRNWRISRLQKFMKKVFQLIVQSKDSEFHDALSDDMEFKKRVHHKHLTELREIKDFNDRDVSARNVLFRRALATTVGNSHERLLQTESHAKFERLRPDLEPFSGIVSNLI